MNKEFIYAIPGLGFDHRIYEGINIRDKELHYLNWIEPELNESIKNYAKRMAEKIKHDPANCILIGHSFGGIIAQEIAALIPIKKIVLISSIKSRKENTLNFKMVAPFRVHRFVSKKMTLNTFDYWGKYFGYETKEVQVLFKKMVALQSEQYLRWALYNLSIWKGVEGNKVPITHIHGSKDKTFPIKNINEPFVKIEGGTHMMVFNKPELMSKILNENLIADSTSSTVSN